MSGPAYFSQPRDGEAGEYRLLYKYLRDRFADRLVLTFSQIEDLIGFSLPGAARLQREWWGEVQPTQVSDAWMLAGRTAIVNLSAQCVTFERDTAPIPQR